MNSKEIADRLRRASEDDLDHPLSFIAAIADELDPPTPKQGVCLFTWGDKSEWFTGLVVGDNVYYSSDGYLDRQRVSKCEISYADLAFENEVIISLRAAQKAELALKATCSNSIVADAIREAIERRGERNI